MNFLILGVPKALLPGVGGKKILDYWWDIIKSRQLFSQVFLVCNADKFKYFERWASSSEFPISNIINDGTTSYETRFVLKKCKCNLRFPPKFGNSTV